MGRNGVLRRPNCCPRQRFHSRLKGLVLHALVGWKLLLEGCCCLPDHQLLHGGPHACLEGRNGLELLGRPLGEVVLHLQDQGLSVQRNLGLRVLLEGLQVLHALGIVGEAAHRLDDGVLAFHDLLGCLLRRHVLVPPAGFGHEAVQDVPHGPAPHRGPEDFHAEVVAEEGEGLEDEDASAEDEPVVADQTLPLHLGMIQLTNVAVLHARAHAELIGILLRNVEHGRQFWIMELVVTWERELDCISFRVGISVLPHDGQQLVGGDVHVTLDYKAILRPLEEGAKGFRSTLLVRDHLEVSEEERHLLGEARKVIPLWQGDEEVVIVHTILVRLHNVVLGDLRSSWALEDGQRHVPKSPCLWGGSSDHAAMRAGAERSECTRGQHPGCPPQRSGGRG
mmetsp:Transcript_5760/g.10294  ORF Transcript_5760/g.10294 Transcript_5760/m.10294 type:complete len:394 (-) Transcript_5760:27-1208(-)